MRADTLLSFFSAARAEQQQLGHKNHLLGLPLQTSVRKRSYLTAGA